MSARERESGELPSPELSLFHRKVGQGLFVLSFRLRWLQMRKHRGQKSLKRGWIPPMLW